MIRRWLRWLDWQLSKGNPDLLPFERGAIRSRLRGR